ncbi:1-phosphatidylinositol 4,5-bisphosphate phosphodiesterase classes I and II isoform X3 [Procambarus clarkii]|uniref:1-phosphatidylinositol 4,5-bisphosphate phosphodiesterase classes I and II isoform X3 n=1 Tax=Procambarus clarkii TaxID=6728 RepID=UPI001E678DBA|nr:1-phosphatidylinositol 4,5-bisphosphate phosphodiesterase classes I and II-like isoform X3 [Procambarus clarkii]
MASAKSGVHVLKLKHISVPQQLQDGDKFVKWDETASCKHQQPGQTPGRGDGKPRNYHKDSSSGMPVTLKVDPQGFYLYWKNTSNPDAETEMLDIMTIRDTRKDKYAKVPKDPKLNKSGSTDLMEQKSFTVVHGPNFVDVSYCNFIAQKPEIAKLWADEILKMAYNLISINASPMTFLHKAYKRLCLTADRSNKVAVKNIVKLFARHGDDKRRVEVALEAAGLPSGKTDTVGVEIFTWDTFLVFYHMLTNRLEVEKVFCSVTDQPFSASKRTKLRGMSVEQLVKFLNEEQRDPRLNEILYPYADTAKATEVIRDYEPLKENISKNVLSCEGFLKYLMSDENTVMSMEKLDQYEDMDQPLAHYFINSSHNTYLIGHQLTGRSSVEMYRQCLLAGCRCVELDFWNGRLEEPVIVHGFTLVPEISAKEVIEGIAESAFKTSEWPVVLSFENHCNPRQQAKIASYCREFFGDMLLDSALDAYQLEPGNPLPPPSSLKRKIIIKNKKKHRTHHHHSHKRNTPGGDSQFHVELNQTGESRPTEMQGNGEIPRPLLEKEGSRESSEEENEVANAFPHLVARLIGEIPDGGVEDVVSSSSDEEGALTPEEIHEREVTSPERGTTDAEEEAGAEISALVNYVQPVHFHSFEAAEKRNRSYEMSSFVETQASNLLKESPMEFVNYNKRQLARVYPRGTRVDSSNFLPHQFWNAGCQLVALNYQTLDLAMQLNLGIFEFNNRSGYLLKPDFMRRPDRRFDPFAESTVDGIIAGTVSVKVISGQFLSDKRVGCYVEVEMYGLPADTVRKRFRTKTVPNNCINPVWDEEPFVFKKVVLPELATIRIVAYEEGGRGSLGNRVLPIVGLRPGYKHITLRNEAGQPLGITSLFVHVKVGDYVPHGLSDFAEALANPIKYQSELEKRAQQLSVFQDDEEMEQEGIDGEPPHTPAKKNESQGLSGEGSLIPGEEGQVKVFKTKSNGEVPDATVPAHESTPIGARRQNSTKPHLNTKPSEEKPDREKDCSLTLLETSKLLIEAEGLDKLWNSKSVKEKRIELDKSIEKIRRKYEKERQSLTQQQEKRRSQLQKSHSKLVKKYSATKGIEPTGPVKRESAQELSTMQEELDARLQELEKSYQASLNELGQATLIAEKKLQEKYHEPIYSALDKAMKMSQAAQLKTLQTLHDKQVDDIKRRTEEAHREKRKGLGKTTGDKEELSRKKREISKQIVAEGIQERQRLTDIHDKKKTELEKQHEEIRILFEEEKLKARNAIETDYEERRIKLEESLSS